MLSKSQAKTFFLVGTALCSVAFIGLTIDTFQRIPAQTNEQNLTAEVIRGKHIFERNNCMGCHTILGEGAYYAPELTKVIERRGEVFVKAMLKDPEAMYPGARKMINYHFNDQEISDLTEFFKWIGKIDLNGFPPKPDLVKTASASATGDTALPNTVIPTANRPQIFNQLCVACHTLQGQGGTVGPVLDGVGSRLDADTMKRRLENPLSVKADSKMPKLPLSPEEITELVAFLSQLKEGK